METQTGREAPRAASVVERTHQGALLGESFEDAAAALAAVESIADVRKELRARKFPSFYQVFEEVDTLNRSTLTAEEKHAELPRLLDAAEGRVSVFSPRIADLYVAIICDIRGEAYQPKFEENQRKLADLRESGDLDLLLSSAQPWEVKLNRLDTRLEGYLAGRRALDRREGNLMDDDMREMRREKLKGAPKHPPGRRNESKPGMDEMERLKEGERVPAMWSIYPAYGGYFREQSLSAWDASRNTWVEPSYKYGDVEMVPRCEREDTKKGIMNITVRSALQAKQWVNLPVPYTHGVSSVECDAEYFLQQDQNGDIVIMVEGEPDAVVDLKVVLSPVEGKTYGPVGGPKAKAAEMPAQFSEATLQAIANVRATRKGSLARALALSAYTRRHLTYSNDSSFNVIYDSDPLGYFGAIDARRQADCDVANTYFAALCAALEIPVRHVVGHSVKGKNAVGSSEITSGTGHAWSEVLDDETNQWVRVLRWTREDATPAGDPNLQEEQQESSGSMPPGDYGNGQEAATISDEKLEELRKKLAERKALLAYTREERDLASATGVDIRLARQIVREIAAAEDTRLPNGKRVTDVLSSLFNAIVESRKVAAEEYDGPVRRSEGGEGISSIVRYKMGVQSGDSDPAARERIEEEEAVEQSFGGFDLYIIGDKSGSMTSQVDNEALLAIQRRAEYLIFSSLHRFERALERAGIPSSESLSVRTQGISFRGSGEGDIDLDKPLSGSLTYEDKVRLWDSLGRQGGGNGDVEALKYVYGQILAEEEKSRKLVNARPRLRFVVACSDGGPDDPEQVQGYAEALGKLGAVVLGVGLTETARAVPVIYTTPFSRGDIAKRIDDLPAIIAKHLVAEAVRLFPSHAKESAQALINSVIAEFKRV